MGVDGGGAVVGAFLGVVFQWIANKGSRALKFKSTRGKHASLGERVIPVAKEAKQWDEKLDRPEEETGIRLIEELEQGQELVKKHSKVPWYKFCCLSCYQEEIQAKDDEVARSLGLVVPITISRDTKEILTIVKGNNERQFNNGLCKPPEKPDLTVGLDVHLNQLRNWVLESGVCVHVLTGLAGSGKTTLATLLCWDEQVRGKFGENILFLPLSKTPDLTMIVQTVFKHRGLPEPELVSGQDHAVVLLKRLMKKIGESPTMLVLDNVWSGSDSVVEEFLVQSSDYKILVTSRVEFPRFSTSRLDPLSRDDDAVTLFRSFALPNDGIRRPYIPHKEVVQQVARGCWGSPLALKLIGTSLHGQHSEAWQKMKRLLSEGRSILVSTSDDLLNRLQKVLDDVLEDKPIIKECFMDLGLFPQDQMVPVAPLLDMWTELNQLDDGGMNIVRELNNLNLVNLVVTREETSHVDSYYNHHFLTQHDLVKEIAIHQARQEPYEQRKRLIFDIDGNDWPQQNQQNAIARTLSITTDNMLTPDWSNIVKAEVVEVLVLNLRTNKYALPEFIRKMSNLKVLIVTNYNGFHFAELNNFEILGCLPNLKRIRLQQVSVPSLCKLNNLQKLSLYMCETSRAFQSDTISISDALPNLVELCVDYCKDLVELPAGLCDITSLKKLSFTRCISLLALPQEIGKLKNLKTLRLSSCAVLEKIPASIGKLHQLHFLDISGCVSLHPLPEEVGNLCNLEELHMTGCSGHTLPGSVTKLERLLHLICDEETAEFWTQYFKPSLPKVEIEEAKNDKLFIIV